MITSPRGTYALLTFLLVSALAVGFVVGSSHQKSQHLSESHLIEEVRVNSSKYHYINPLLFTRTSKETNSHYSNLEQSLSELIERKKAEGKADAISVYFRDMNSGRWTGVNESEKYTPSSLLKVATLMSVLKKSEENPKVLSQQLFYDPVTNKATAQIYVPQNTLPLGSYSVDELLKRMAIESDNVASTLLVNHYNQQFNDLYSSFRLPDLPANFQDFMSPRTYSVLFRSLYNASYLSEDNSERALELLSQTTFNRGLVAGIPRSIKVAHKFGENTNLNSNGEVEHHELHDCGIVYYPGRPYFLCVMTQGKEFSELEKVIEGISEIVYTTIATENP